MTATADLTPSQQAAVEHLEGPLLVLAGPGSGKTRVITRRIARLIESGVPARQILAITFTNKAAREMDARVQSLLPGARVWVSTFHRFCAKLLRRYASVVGLQPNFTILDTSDQKQMLRDVMSDLNIDPTHYSLARVLHRIGEAKHRVQSAEMMARGVEEVGGSFFDTVVAKVYVAYEQALLTANGVDFDDLLLHVCRIFSESEEIRADLDAHYRYVLVDEYQDTNLAQYHIITALSRDYPNLCVTGDPDQSIYGWRGAEIGNILRFETDFPATKVVRLEQNYRSTKEILRSADSLISHNVYRKAKDLFTENPIGEPVELLTFQDEAGEADGLARMIQDLAEREQRPWSDFAVFFRVNALSRGLELAFMRHRVPYQMAAGVAFWERAEIKDVLAYLRLVYNPSDRIAFLRVVNTPLRGIGKNSVGKLSDWAAGQGITLLEAARRAREVPELSKRAATALRAFAELIDEFSAAATGGVAELIELILRRTRYTAAWQGSTDESDIQRLANVEELATAARQYDEEFADDPTLEGFLETTSLVADVDSLDSESGKVTLMTLHAAKGLEFPVVFVVAVEHNLLPHERSMKEGDPRELEEERRLLFVGMTRAEERLFLTETRVRNFRGKRFATVPSQFLGEMPLRQRDFGEDWSLNQDQERDPFDEAIEQRRSTGSDDTSGVDEHSEHADLDADQDRESALAQPGDAFHTFDDEAQQQPSAGESASPLRRDRAPAGRGPARGRAAASAARPTVGATGEGSASPTASPSFTVGMSVRHPRYGLGKVIDQQGTGKWRTVTVEFAPGEAVKFIESKCPLQPVGIR